MEPVIWNSRQNNSATRTDSPHLLVLLCKPTPLYLRPPDGTRKRIGSVSSAIWWSVCRAVSAQSLTTRIAMPGPDVRRFDWLPRLSAGAVTYRRQIR